MTFKKDKNSRGCLFMKTVSKSENNSFLNRKFHYTQKGSSLKNRGNSGSYHVSCNGIHSCCKLGNVCKSRHGIV